MTCSYAAHLIRDYRLATVPSSYEGAVKQSNFKTSIFINHSNFKCLDPGFDALWSPTGKVLTYWLSFVMSNCDVITSHWYPESGVVLDCIHS